MSPARWLPLAAVMIAATGVLKPPVLDEESYLFIGAQLDPWRPYDWTRTWQGSSTYAFAHPPLFLEWMHQVGRLGVVGARLVSLPFAALLGWAVGLLAGRTCRHPNLAAASWLASAVVVIGLQNTLMIDLPAVALATGAVAVYRESLDREGPWGLLAGVLLGLAIETKYTMGFVALALFAHGFQWSFAPQLWLGMLAVMIPVEGALWTAYGELHPLAVWAGRHEIASGDTGPRAVGMLARMVLLPMPLVLLRTHMRGAAAGVFVTLLALGLTRPDTRSASYAVALFACCTAGTIVFARAIGAAASPATRRRKGDRGDALLLGGWILAVGLGIVAMHNYAAARYLWPAAAPVALLLTRSAEDVPGGKLLQRGSIAVGAGLALLVALADWRFANASVEVADRALGAAMDLGHPTGAFAGEWGFRWRMESAGWSRLTDGTAADVLVVVENASPGTVVREGYVAARSVESRDTFPFRVVDVEENVGMYAETLGVMPFGFGRGPLERATIYVRRGAGK